jgi:hypothetical protein
MSRSDPDPRERVSQQRAQAVLDGVATDWLARQGVISVEVARRWVQGIATDEVGIRVTVERLLPEDQVPEGQLFPDSLEGVPVDVREGHAPQLET